MCTRAKGEWVRLDFNREEYLYYICVELCVSYEFASLQLYSDLENVNITP